LLYHECKNLEMDYLLQIGALEYRVYELDCEVRRARLKANLIQARLNRQEPVDLERIERQLDAEFVSHQTELQQRLAQMNAALARRQWTLLSAEEARELKRLYRAIGKALHPDLHPDLPPGMLQLFHNAVSAYEHGDLHALRAIEVMVSVPEPPDLSPNPSRDALERLALEKERLTAILDTIRSRIEAIKSAYPYTMKRVLQDPEQVAARQTRLREQIRGQEEALVACQERITELLRGDHGR
jgi:hypothetical protein